MKLIIFVLVVLVASFSVAGQPAEMVDYGGEACRQGTDIETIYWSQLPTGTTMASQFFTDTYPTYDAGVADDFEFDVSTTINMIRWWGGYWNGTTPVPIDCPVEIYLYLDDGTGNAPTLPQHTSAIDSWMIGSGEYTEAAEGVNYVCEYEFPLWVVFDPGVKYWIEIRKAFPLTPMGQYGLIQSEPVNLSPCVRGFDGHSIPWWTAQSTDAAFELIFDDELALESSTWAEIKTIF